MNKIIPGREEFVSWGETFNLIPLYKEISSDMETPVSAYKKISSAMGGFSFLLESVEGGETWGRYSFLGFSPIATFTARGAKSVAKVGNGEERSEGEDPLALLRRMMGKFHYHHIEDLGGMTCGAVGYVGYDYVRHIELLPDETLLNHSYPDLYFMIPSTVIVFDNLMKKIRIAKNVYLKEGDDPISRYECAVGEIDELIGILSLGSVSRGERREKKMKPLKLNPALSEKELADRIKAVKKYIQEGEAIQVVISNRYTGCYEGDPFDVYRALRMINPSPYMFYIEGEEVKVAGSSPEVFVRLKGKDIILRPIAGTRPRGKTELEDEKLRRELLSDPKELAEHLMLVDLGRNDLGRVSSPGSVAVNEFQVIENYSHVMHIVSNIQSHLMEDMDAVDVFRATFPAGTVTGAPKVRAMEIIEESETEKRGIYAGAVGYFDFSGNMDFCIAIRTLIFHGEKVIVQAGAGIVFDSSPEYEIVEIDNKARALREAIMWGLNNDSRD